MSEERNLSKVEASTVLAIIDEGRETTICDIIEQQTQVLLENDDNESND